MQSSLRVGAEAAAGDYVIRKFMPKLDEQDYIKDRPVVMDTVHGLLGVVVGEKLMGKDLGLKKLVGVGAGIMVVKYAKVGEMILPKTDNKESPYSDALDAGLGAATGYYVAKMVKKE